MYTFLFLVLLICIIFSAYIVYKLYNIMWEEAWTASIGIYFNVRVVSLWFCTFLTVLILSPVLLPIMIFQADFEDKFFEKMREVVRSKL